MISTWGTNNTDRRTLVSPVEVKMVSLLLLALFFCLRFLFPQPSCQKGTPAYTSVGVLDWISCLGLKIELNWDCFKVPDPAWKHMQYAYVFSVTNSSVEVVKYSVWLLWWLKLPQEFFKCPRSQCLNNREQKIPHLLLLA